MYGITENHVKYVDEDTYNSGPLRAKNMPRVAIYHPALSVDVPLSYTLCLPFFSFFFPFFFVFFTKNHDHHEDQEYFFNRISKYRFTGILLGK